MTQSQGSYLSNSPVDVDINNVRHLCPLDALLEDQAKDFRMLSQPPKTKHFLK